MASAQRP